MVKASAASLLTVLLGWPGSHVCAERPPMEQFAVEHTGQIVHSQAEADDSSSSDTVASASALLANPRAVGMLLRAALSKSRKAWEADRGSEVPSMLQALGSTVRKAHASHGVLDMVRLAAEESQQADSQDTVLELLSLAEKQDQRMHRSAPSQGQQQPSVPKHAQASSLPTNSLMLSSSVGVESQEDLPRPFRPGVNSQPSPAATPTQDLPRPFRPGVNSQPSPAATPTQEASKRSSHASVIAEAPQPEAQQPPSPSVSESSKPSSHHANVPPLAPEPEKIETIFNAVGHRSAHVERDLGDLEKELGGLQQHSRNVKGTMGAYEKSIETLTQTLDEADAAKKEWTTETFNQLQKAEPWRIHPLTDYLSVDEAKLKKFEDMVGGAGKEAAQQVKQDVPLNDAGQQHVVTASSTLESTSEAAEVQGYIPLKAASGQSTLEVSKMDEVNDAINDMQVATKAASEAMSPSASDEPGDGPVVKANIERAKAKREKVMAALEAAMAEGLADG